jgi:hypothetical protein
MRQVSMRRFAIYSSVLSWVKRCSDTYRLVIHGDIQALKV